MKRSILIAALFVSMLLTLPQTDFLTPTVTGEGSGDYPPPATGNWTVTRDTYIRDETVVVSGNITVQSGATLTLDHVNLVLNATDYGNLYIRVKSGGELNIVNDSVLSEGETGVNYDFVFENDSSGQIRNSTITDCGWNDGGTYQSSGGILIMSNDVVVDGSDIRNCYYGIVVFFGAPVISNNNISDNLKQGIALYYAFPVITGNVIATTPIGLSSRNSEVTLVDNKIIDNGDGFSITYSTVNITGGEIASNSREDCTTGTCSSSESGKGIDAFASELSLEGVVISENDDSALQASYSGLDIRNSTFTGNDGSGIEARNWWGTLSGNDFSANSRYGISSLSGANNPGESNTFSKDNGMGRVLVEWGVRVFVEDSYGKKVSHAGVVFTGNGTTISSNTSYSGVAYTTVAEYLMDNQGDRVDYNPYTITASKKAVWNGMEYSNSTTLNVNDDLDVNITIPLVSPDLRVSAIGIPSGVSVDEKTTIEVEIENIGHARADNVQVTVFETDTEGVKTIVNRTTISVDTDRSQKLSVAWTPNQAGDYTIEVSVATGYDELSVANNEMERPVEILEKEPGIFHESYLLAAFVSILVIAAGSVIYLVAMRKRRREPDQTQ